ncbi:S-adenosyl-L-methionine-dependent methyltransferase [Byssothecium circinans]|uniref:S-adenosyl-L-methionine-dependent methyltransferase n=1 Tax=Byssothecium circinans TaxID=147558 RepID=A0A6A5TMP7_9PLEO|nr:S-adenosyl-L-methionine-dependent methyltransferase [Byssothecium circinans]
MEIMEAVLEGLVASLEQVLSHLNGDAKASLQTSLHDTSKLPNKEISSLSYEALDLLSRVRLLLEPPHLILADHFLGYMNTKALCAAVELHVPDILQSGPRTLEKLATECKARPDRLRQIMRTLHNNGIFEYSRADDKYSNNHTATLLLSDHWSQWQNWVHLYGNEFYDMARGIPASCTEDATRCPAQINYNTEDSMFKYFTDQGWIAKLHKTLSGSAVAQAPGIIEDYPWEEVANGTVVDVGGGGGGLIALLLRKYKTMKGAVLDAPAVIEQARANFHGPEGQYRDVSDQIPSENLIAGDFFVELPTSDVFTIKWCLHDWDDEKASIILTNIRKALKRSSKSRLVILESVLTDGHIGRMTRYADINMMVAVGGKERDEAEWRKLAEATGWKLRKIYPLRNAWPSAIEFVPVWPAKEDVKTNVKTNDDATREGSQVVATMRFLEPWDSSRGDPYIRINAEPGYGHMNFEWRDYAVNITDARPKKGQFRLDTHGFAYYDDTIPADVINALRGDDKNAIKKLYYRHVEEFVKKVTGAPRVIIFDHTLRKRRTELELTENNDGKEQPATMVHCDQSEKGALRRLTMNLGENESLHDVLKGRVQMINVWRPLNGPVKDWPLATMDFKTAKSNEMYSCNLYKGTDEERGQTATYTFSEAQKWFYLNEQQTDEVTVIKIWDSKVGGVSRFCAHSAFHHPRAPLDVEPRESVEVRCFAIQ